MPVVTVGLPVYNAAPYLADTIQSVLNQTFQDWELLIVDDGSTDNSVGIARSFSDSRIKLVVDGKNRNQSVRLNQICRMAKSPYIARMDADDIMTIDRLQMQIAFMEENRTVDLVSSFVYSIDFNNRLQGIRGSTSMPKTLGEAVTGFPIIHPAVLTRRRWSLKNPYNEQIPRVQDYELWMRTFLTSQFAIIDRPLLFYREIGIPYKKKYLNSSAQIRSILRRQYRHKLGIQKMTQVLIATRLKDALYTLFSFFKQEDWLLMRRNRPLHMHELDDAQKMLTQSIQRNLTHRL
ncbi:glycosyltransferase family 2 protein [Larkinella sp. GY13]|uniref:glycosyltransferase family 2 protein n=1 Tax=Larkinella sp. GY13 TaxID=3453720 RepID=UPI003EE85BB3